MPVGTIRVGTRTLSTTPTFDTYWRFAAERQAIFWARLDGDPPPWTCDPVLGAYRFTNAYRATDRVSQYLINVVQRDRGWSVHDLVVRTLLFKFFNKIETWEALEERVGRIDLNSFDLDRYASALGSMARTGPLYSGAYVVPPPDLGARRKYINHLRLLRMMLDDRVVEHLMAARSMRRAYEALRAYPSIGPFLAYQFVIDLNYTKVLHFSEMDDVVAGPGARAGLRRCFVDLEGVGPAAVIRHVTEHQDEHFARLGLAFRHLPGRKLQLIDCQNLFCELDKYARALGGSTDGRAKMKRRFTPTARLIGCQLPPKWRVQPVENVPESTRSDSSISTRSTCARSGP